LLQVVDISDPNWQEHIAVVNEILEELGVHKHMLYVFNKSDRLEEHIDISSRVYRYSPYVVTCAKSKEGLADLIEYLSIWRPAREHTPEKES
jgi:50S ribosomal subunit-associated GTPase HflX